MTRADPVQPTGPTGAGVAMGAVIAGGRSTRYGGPKALVEIGGRRLIDRVIDALRPVTPDVVVITNDTQLGALVSVPARPDRLPGLGALGGIHAALHWAAEIECQGILAVACDMPFLSSALLSGLIALANRPGAPDVVVPESDGPRGFEPLCAYYSVACLAAIEAAVRVGDRRMIGFHESVTVQRMPRHTVAAYGDPERLFFNVNTKTDHERADQLLARGTVG